MNCLSVDNFNNANPLGTECVSYTETTTDLGKIYTASIHPKHFALEENFRFLDKDSEDARSCEIKDRLFRKFFVEDEIKSTVEKKHPSRMFTYIDDIGEVDYINNLAIPFYLTLFQDMSCGSRPYHLAFVLVVSYTEFSFFNYINYTNILYGKHSNLPNPENLDNYKMVIENSEDNVLVLNYDNKRELFTCEYLDYVSVTESNNGDVLFSFNVTGYAYDQRTETFFKDVADKYELRLYRYGNASLLKNRQLICSSKGMYRAFHKIITDSWICSAFYRSGSHSTNKHPPKHIFLRLLEKHFFKRSISSFIDSRFQQSYALTSKLQKMYRVMRNKKLLDLPWSENELSNIYDTDDVFCNDIDKKKFYLARNNINRHLRKGNTKRATEFCYYGFKFPKAIKKLLLKIPPLSLTYTCTQLLFEVYEKFGVNITLNAMKDDAGEVNFKYIRKESYLKALLLGFKKNRLMTAGIGRISDAMDMRNILMINGVNVAYDTNNFIEYHDYISALYTAIIKSDSSCHTKAYKLINTSMQLPSITINGFTLRSPKNTYELVDVGTDMRHCVASYCRDYYYRNLEILLIEKNNTYVACIEIRDKFIVQAKLKFNAPIIDNKEVFNALKVWSEKYGYILDSTDCGIQKNKFSNVLEYQDSDDIHRSTVVSRLNYLDRLNVTKFKVADKDALKQTLSPGWLVVLDHHCALNTHGAGLRIWTSEKQPLEYEITRDIWRDIFDN